MLLTPWGRYTSNFLLLDANETNDFLHFKIFLFLKNGEGGRGGPGGPCSQGGTYGLNHRIIEES